MNNETILSVFNLKKYFKASKGIWGSNPVIIKAVDGVSFSVDKGQTVGLVGETGCGKSTVGRTILRLVEKTDGDVLFHGQDLYKLKKEELRRLRPRLQIIFQDPYSSLNPRLTVGQIIGEALLEHRIASKSTVSGMVEETLKLCGLDSYHMRRFPHEFSGGQRQRIGIARALALKPEFIVADEPLSALDVSIQAQIINLLREIQEQFGISYLFISHDLSVVRHISHFVGVMYLGSIVEFASKYELFKNPLHPYTKALLSAIPVPDPFQKKERIILEGDPPDPSNPPSGCKFHTRCPYKRERCVLEVPEYRDFGGHSAACHFI